MMKTRSFLISFLVIFSIFSAAAAQVLRETVHDQYRHSLVAGEPYYIVPSPLGPDQGGGVILGDIDNEIICPRAVLQNPGDFERGLPVEFTPVNAEEKEIYRGAEINIKIASILPLICNESSVWKIGQYGEPIGRYLVTTGGVEGSDLFKIEKTNNGRYKLVFCVLFLCNDVGIFHYNGQRYLALSYTPFEVQFWKPVVPGQMTHPGSGVVQ